MANVVKKYSISYELAQKMVDAAVAKARELGVSENVAILDDGGNLKAFGRMDGAPIPTTEMAQNKAYTALFGVSTQEFFNFIQSDPSLLAGIPTLARMAAWGGGFPIKANGIRFAYRRFGKTGGVPIVFNQHYIGTMDYWDPTVTDGLARDREVILFNNAGVSSSSGEVTTTFEHMRANAIAFINALGLKQVDVLGFSIGGMVAQEITLQAPDLVRRLVLVGTGPRGGESMDTGTPEGKQIFGSSYEHPDDLWLRVHFTPSDVSQAAGRKFLKRFRLRTKDRDPEVTEKAALAQRAAIAKWGAKREHAWDYLKDIKQPTLVVNGSDDVIIDTINSYILQQNLPNAQLVIYPDSAHGSLYQYPELFVRHVSMFLSAADPWAS